MVVMKVSSLRPASIIPENSVMGNSVDFQVTPLFMMVGRRLACPLKETVFLSIP